MVRMEFRNQHITSIRNEIGSIQGQNEIHIYMRFKLALMNLHVSLRPKEASWPIVFLDVFVGINKYLLFIL